ncbi:MAG: thioesterase family protein [Acidimicrobiia bacterium]|nr:thioesterase family protein [Acidimicrobiia bacterium]
MHAPRRPPGGASGRAPVGDALGRRVAAGVVPGPTSEAVTGGWIRLPEGRVVDPLVAAAITDAWLPPLFSRLVRESVAVPTLDLTVHFRSALPLPAARPDDWVLCVFRSKVAAEGFVEEDGEVWSREGVLLAQSRQLAAMVPFRSR